VVAAVLELLLTAVAALLLTLAGAMAALLAMLAGVRRDLQAIQAEAAGLVDRAEEIRLGVAAVEDLLVEARAMIGRDMAMATRTTITAGRRGKAAKTRDPDDT
jgi:hypothetical protein